jgi:hypothetical protein
MNGEYFTDADPGVATKGSLAADGYKLSKIGIIKSYTKLD